MRVRHLVSVAASIVATIAVMIGGAGVARAEIAIGESIDWLVVSRSHIGVYEVVEVAERGAEGDATFVTRTLTLRRSSAKRGEPPETVTVIRHVPAGGKAPGRGGPHAQPAPKKGGRFLIFMASEPASPGVDPEVDQAIDLAHPQTRGFRDVAFTTSFGVLKDGEKILAVVDARLAKLAKTPPAEKADPKAANVFTPERGFRRLEVPHDSEAHAALWAGSSCYLVVPDDAAPVPEPGLTPAPGKKKSD